MRIAANTPAGQPLPRTPPEPSLNWGSGRRLVSCSTRRGASVVERAFIAPPGQPHRPPSAAERRRYSGSLLYGRYDTQEDRESAFEQLQEASPAADDETASPQTDQGRSAGYALNGILFSRTGPRSQHDGVVQTAAKSVASHLGNRWDANDAQGAQFPAEGEQQAAPLIPGK